MAGTRRHGMNATIWIDDSGAGTMPIGTLAAGTANLTLISSKNSWDFDMSRDLVDVTSFGDTSKTNVAGLAGASGTVNGFVDFASPNLIKNVLTSSTERGIIIFPDATNNITTFIIGKAFISGKASGQETGAVTLDLTFNAGPSGIVFVAA